MSTQNLMTLHTMNKNFVKDSRSTHLIVW